MASDKEFLLEQALAQALREGRITRRQFMQAIMTGGLGLAGVSVLAACAAPAVAPTAAPPTAASAAPTSAPAGATSAPGAGTRPLTATFYNWMEQNIPYIAEFTKSYPNTEYQIAPTVAFGIERFVAEAKNQQSTWDVYGGTTPFVEMVDLIKTGAIEPWDPYIPKSVVDDMIPAVRAECTYDGKLYAWPFLLDIIVQAYNSNLTTKAGLPDKPPVDWDEYLANSKTVLDKGAARYGCTFDSNGWRSLAPITHSISTDVYYQFGKEPEPLYDFTNDASIQALQIMKQMLDLSSANALQPGTTDGGVNNTPDEVAFGAQSVAYYIKYQNAPLRFANKWTDPNVLRLGGLPKAKGGAGATVFWDTGLALFKYGQNKERAAEYLTALTYNDRIWKESIGGSATSHPGQLPPFKSIYEKWAKEQPDWLKGQPWVPLVFEQLKVAKAIPNNSFGLKQFQIGKQYWEKYLKGEEKDPKVAMQAAKDAVQAEIKKTQ
jgi:multiple sugar transport system substrate-binding protein